MEWWSGYLEFIYWNCRVKRLSSLIYNFQHSSEHFKIVGVNKTEIEDHTIDQHTPCSQFHLYSSYKCWSNSKRRLSQKFTAKTLEYLAKRLTDQQI